MLPICVEDGDHRVLAARRNIGTPEAVGGNLLRQPGVRDDGEAQTREVRRLMREHAERPELLAGAPGAELDQTRRPRRLPRFSA